MRERFVFVLSSSVFVVKEAERKTAVYLCIVTPTGHDAWNQYSPLANWRCRSR